MKPEAAPVDLRAQGRSLRVDSYFLDAVMKSLEETYSPEVVYHGGLRVYTTLDVGMQQQAETALQEGIAGLESQMDMAKGATATIGGSGQRAAGGAGCRGGQYRGGEGPGGGAGFFPDPL
jgi:membrane peptidoglycan carboxypeptidase